LLGEAMPFAVSFSHVKRLKLDRSGQTPHSSSQRVGRLPYRDRPRLPTATPCPSPFGLRTRFPHCRSRLRLPGNSASRSARDLLRRTLALAIAVGSRRLRRLHVRTAGFSWTSPAVLESGGAFGALFNVCIPSFFLLIKF
jgi:hypothetical protein